MDQAFVSPHLWLLEHAAVEKEVRAKRQGQGQFLKTSAAEEGGRIAVPILAFELRISTFLRSHQKLRHS